MWTRARPSPKPLKYLLARLAMRAVVRLLYRVRIVGRRHCPRKGAALLVANHLSYADALLVAFAAPRIVHFLMSRTYYELPLVHRFFKAMGAIPVSTRDNPKAVLRSLEAARAILREGKVLCIFAEGTVSRHGQMNRFKKGFEKIAEGLGAPVVPVHLDRLWGSLFSFEGGTVLFKWPRRIPHPATVSFGPPLPSTANAHEVRGAISELGAGAFRLRLAEKGSLGVEFARSARRRQFRTALEDSSGRRLSFGAAFVSAAGMAAALAQRAGGEARVGVMLPAGVDGALAVLALALCGKAPVMLGLRLSREAAAERLARAGASRVVTSRRVAAGLGWAPAGAIFVEDLPAPGLMERLAARRDMLLLGEEEFLRRRAPLAGAGHEDVAAVLFTRGTTGPAKAVELTHGNILSNVEAIAQVYATLPSDLVLGVLTLHHALGFTGTLWLPLLQGVGAAYHHDPSDARGVAALARRAGATILVATPSMLAAYIRRVPPRGFGRLRLVVTGAEKLPDELAAAWLDKYGTLPLEGYGCTELSPVAAVNIPDVDWERVYQEGGRVGTIGRPLPGVSVRTVDPRTGEPTPEGVPGQLVVRGPNVMKGYAGDPAATAEVLRGGGCFTGDTAVIDGDGFLTIEPRAGQDQGRK